MSALRAGAGLVTLGIASSLNAVLAARMLEAMTEPLPEREAGILDESAFEAIEKLMAGKKCLAIGPGLGQAAETKKLVNRIVQTSAVPMVIDADGLNNLAGQVQVLRKAGAEIVLTPHPGEMARLMDLSTGIVQQDRIKSAREFAVEFQVHVVLKGARTVIAHPDGRIFINPTGNAGMASGGMGDVLTGIIAGFMVQGMSAETAAHAGVYLHGLTADWLAETIGPFGYLAGDVMDALPGQIKKIVSDR
jgi:NAD(P)H-hydrate epimerase